MQKKKTKITYNIGCPVLSYISLGHILLVLGYILVDFYSINVCMFPDTLGHVFFSSTNYDSEQISSRLL